MRTLKLPFIPQRSAHNARLCRRLTAGGKAAKARRRHKIDCPPDK
jgi:hypothetical protein